MTLRPSDRVQNALEAGWSSLCDGLAAVHWYRFPFRKGRGDYRTAHVRAGDREIQVSISPSGRSVRVFVDGTEVPSLGTGSGFVSRLVYVLEQAGFHDEEECDGPDDVLEEVKAVIRRLNSAEILADHWLDRHWRNQWARSHDHDRCWDDDDCEDKFEAWKKAQA